MLFRSALIELIAEGDDALMEEFFEKGTLPVEHIVDGLREAVHHRSIFPVMCTSGGHNVGSDLILNFVSEDFPNPQERGPWKGTANGAETEREEKDTAPVSLFVFKTLADPFAGRVTYFRVVSGVLKNDANLIVARTSNTEKLSHIGALHGKAIEETPEMHAGDIGGVGKICFGSGAINEDCFSGPTNAGAAHFCIEHDAKTFTWLPHNCPF